MPDLTRLRRALSFEAQHGYQNIKGNERRFADFVAAELIRLIGELPIADRGDLSPLTPHFMSYDVLPLDERTRLGEIARITIENEAGVDIILPEAVLQHAKHDLV